MRKDVAERRFVADALNRDLSSDSGVLRTEARWKVDAHQAGFRAGASRTKVIHLRRVVSGNKGAGGYKGVRVNVPVCGGQPGTSRRLRTPLSLGNGRYVAPNIREHRGWQCQRRGIPLDPAFAVSRGAGSDRTGSNVCRRAGLWSIASRCASLRICRREWCAPSRGVCHAVHNPSNSPLPWILPPVDLTARSGDVIRAEALGGMPIALGVGASVLIPATKRYGSM